MLCTALSSSACDIHYDGNLSQRRTERLDFARNTHACNYTIRLHIRANSRIVGYPPSIFGERARAAERRLCFFLRTPAIRTNVYIDGFNLYYGAAKNTPYKWLNPAALCEAVLPGFDIGRIRYFTALVKSRPSDPQTLQRQQMYIRALETLPNLTVHYGHYLRSEVMMRTVAPPPNFVNVIKMEEKGSDVNIATYVLVDAFRRDCEQLVLITNDSDLAEPVRIINKELGLPVGIFNPHTDDTAIRRARLTNKPVVPAAPSIQLRKMAKFHRDITSEGPASHMARSQFADELTDATGRTFRKPAGW